MENVSFAEIENAIEKERKSNAGKNFPERSKPSQANRGHQEQAFIIGSEEKRMALNIRRMIGKTIRGLFKIPVIGRVAETLFIFCRLPFYINRLNGEVNNLQVQLNNCLMQLSESHEHVSALNHDTTKQLRALEEMSRIRFEKIEQNLRR